MTYSSQSRSSCKTSRRAFNVSWRQVWVHVQHANIRILAEHMEIQYRWRCVIERWSTGIQTCGCHVYDAETTAKLFRVASSSPDAVTSMSRPEALPGAEICTKGAGGGLENGSSASRRVSPRWVKRLNALPRKGPCPSQLAHRQRQGSRKMLESATFNYPKQPSSPYTATKS